LLNRLISGYGVLCGLDVQPADKGRAVVVTPGAALDRAGREIVVPRASEPIAIPERPEARPAQPPAPNCEPGDYGHLCICFQRCDTDPTPVLVDDCGQSTSCSASSILERYKLVIHDCKAPEISLGSGAADFVLNGRLNYRALVERVTQGCPELPTDLCI